MFKTLRFILRIIFGICLIVISPIIAIAVFVFSKNWRDFKDGVVDIFTDVLTFDDLRGAK